MSLRILILCLALAAGPLLGENDVSQQPDLQTVIRELGLEAHVEGGYFRRSFQADHRPRID